MFTSTWFSSAQSFSTPTFLGDLCDKILRAHTVLARFRTLEVQKFLKKKI